MRTFNILIVEDDLDYLEKLINLLKRGRHDLLGPDVDPNVVQAANQEEADAALTKGPEYGFDLIILDLHYPRKGPDIDPDFHGITWLPKVRHAQPDAAIVVMTSYGHETFLVKAVLALRDGKADEFIPKDTPWPDMRLRIRGALDWASRRRSERLATRVASVPMRSQVARPAAEDILRAAQTARSRLLQIAEELKASGTPGTGAVAGAIQGELDTLDHKLSSSVAKLAGPQAEDARPVHCGSLARDLGDYFRIQLSDEAGLVETSPEGNDLTALTYKEDLIVALKEVLQNAVLAASRGEAKPPKISIGVQRQAEYVRIAISDSGSGFSAPAVDHMFEQDNSHWPDGESSQHAGMGLHIARRMMFSIGGNIVAENAEGHACVTLFVRDWATP